MILVDHSVWDSGREREREREREGGGGGEGTLSYRPVGDVSTFRVSIFSKNSRTGFKISVNIPEQAFQKPMIFQNR